MNANGRELILNEEVFETVECAMEVLNVLGHGRLKKPKVIERITGLKIGIILNVKRAKLEWTRMFSISIRVHSRLFAVLFCV